jgi:hypothetical protein
MMRITRRTTIELPADYVLIVNQKTATEFGLTIPPTMRLFSPRHCW